LYRHSGARTIFEVLSKPLLFKRVITFWGGNPRGPPGARGSGSGIPSAWRFWGIYYTKLIHFRHVSAEILPEKLRNMFIIVRLCTCSILVIILFKISY